MNVIIIGCGETGSRLAQNLDRLGYDVAIVERDKGRFELLDSDFSGLCVHGTAIDVDILRNAGCDNADVAIVVTNNDNVNVMAARILDVEFGIKDVYVRLLDTSRESVFRKFGLKTVCPTRLECDALLNLVTESAEKIKPTDISGTALHFNMVKADKKEEGKALSDIRCKNSEMPFALKRKDGTLHLASEHGLKIMQGDMIVYANI